MRPRRRNIRFIRWPLGALLIASGLVATGQALVSAQDDPHAASEPVRPPQASIGPRAETPGESSTELLALARQSARAEAGIDSSLALSVLNDGNVKVLQGGRTYISGGGHAVTLELATPAGFNHSGPWITTDTVATIARHKGVPVSDVQYSGHEEADSLLQGLKPTDIVLKSWSEERETAMGLTIVVDIDNDRVLAFFPVSRPPVVTRSAEPKE